MDRFFADRIVSWFRENGRLLPWREGKDPYRIWISEIMLQQTRIEAVIPYYHRFLERLPSPAALADCPDDELMKLWEGLGYYSRARNLKKAALAVMEKFNGTMPRTAAELKSLPGIGEYTAGAISSIAFGEAEPAVDGNVLRVVTRYLGDKSDIALEATKKKITSLLKEIYPAGTKAGMLTEGIMEVGERICIPNGVPLCEACPLKEKCVAKKENLTDVLPIKSPKKERKVIDMTVFILCHNGKYAFRQRPSTGLLAKMWEFYHVDGKKTKIEALDALKAMGFSPVDIRPCGSAKHIFTHLEWRMTGFLVTVENENGAEIWKSAEEIQNFIALPTAFRHFKNKLQ